MIYEIGDAARLRASFRDADSLPADPTTVLLIVQSPDNTQATYAYDALEIQRTSMGEYFYDLLITQVGVYLYRYTGSGSISAVEEGQITVRSTTLVPQPQPFTAPTAITVWTLYDLQALNTAIKGGVKQVHFQDRTVTYHSLAEMLNLRALMIGELAIGAVLPVNRQIRMVTGTGL